MMTLASPEHARLLEPAAGWVYLGKDLGRRAQVESRLGAPSLSLGGLLREEALRLKAPFLDLIARLGRAQSDPTAWWAGTLPWKAWGASDLFLLCCYQSLVERLRGANPPQGLSPALVIVEDPWLLRQLETAGGALWPACLAAAALGAARRAKWALRMAQSLLAQAWHSHGKRPVLPAAGGIVLYSHLLERSLAADGRWSDHYLPGFEEELSDLGHPVLRCTYPDDTGWEQALAERSQTVAPLILYASWRGFFRALMSLPPAAEGPQRLDGRSIELLLRRERWQDLSRAGRCAAIFLEDCAARFFAATPWKALVFPWENQPQERMLLLAARGSGMKTVGYQHTTVPRLQLPFFSARGEADWAPMPDLVLTSGPYALRLLCEDGMPSDRLRLGGSRRYAHLSAASTLGPTSSEDVLVILPLDECQASHLLAALARAYPCGGAGFRFLIKAHPAAPLAPKTLGFPAELVDGDLAAALAHCAVVVFSGTTSGIEALLAGRPALRYRPELLLDVDPSELLSDAVLPTATDGDLREKLERLRHGDGVDNAEARAALSELFSPVLPAVWREAVEEAPRRPR